MVEKTDNYIRVPSGKRKKKDSKIRTIDISSDKGIKALYDAENKVIVTYLFDRDKWTMKEAKEWVKKNKKNEAHLIIVRNRYMLDEMARLLEEHKKEVVEKTFKLMEENKNG